jgi:hypothetical protein
MTKTGSSVSRLSLLQLALYLTGDVAWIFAWSVAIGAWIDAAEGAPPLQIEAIAGIALAAALVTRLVPRVSNERVVRLAVAGLGLFAALAVAGLAVGQPPWSGDGGWARLVATPRGWYPASTAALALIAWWRGIAAGRASFTVDVVASGFRGAVTGLVGLFLIALLAGSTSAVPAGPLTSLAVVVLFTGLLGMPLARILHAGNAGHPGSAPLRVSRQWLSLLLGTILGLILVAILLASVLTFERLDRLLSPFAEVLALVVYLIALPLGFLVEALVDLLRALLHPGDRVLPPTPPLARLLDSLKDRPVQGSGPPDVVGQILTVAAVALLAALIVWLLARAVGRRTERTTDEGVEEVREVIWSWAEIRSALARWFAAWRRQRRQSLAALVQRRRSIPDAASHPMTPRELYRELLRLGARAGQRRSPDETPNEYEQSLVSVTSLAGGENDIRTLTEVYVQDRYAPEPPSQTTVDIAREAWERLRAIEASRKSEN